MRRVLLAFPLISLLGCSAKIDDLITFTDQVKQNTPVNIEPYPKFKTVESVSYESKDTRSPFQRVSNSPVAVEEIATTQCDRPNRQRRKEALEEYGIDALNMAGVFTSNNQKWALVKANDGRLFKVKYGSYLGLFYGKVVQINDQEIIIREMLPDGAGCWKKKETSLSMSSLVGEKNDV